MVQITKKTWKWRSLISFFLLFAAIAVLVSGIVLFIAPIGRVAHSTNWHLLGLDKGQWESVHTNFGYVGTLFGVAHLALNWQVILCYLRDRVRRAYRLRAELIVALVLTIVIGLGSALAWPPFSTVMDWGESLKSMWESNSTTSIIREDGTANTLRSDPSTGWGRFTVAEICKQQGIPIADGLAHLADHGIAADSSSRVRTLADDSGYAPSAVVDIIIGSGPKARD